MLVVAAVVRGVLDIKSKLSPSVLFVAALALAASVVPTIEPSVRRVKP
jgi:hypothetical protein